LCHKLFASRPATGEQNNGNRKFRGRLWWEVRQAIEKKNSSYLWVGLQGADGEGADCAQPLSRRVFTGKKQKQRNGKESKQETDKGWPLAEPMGAGRKRGNKRGGKTE